MNRIERILLACMLVLTSGMVLYVKHVADAERRRIPKPILTQLKPETVIGVSPRYRGDAGAPFTLIEFADYQCPACIASHLRVLSTLEKHNSRMKLVFHHFPLAMHPQAKTAATVAEAADEQGRFWDMHDLLMAARGHLQTSDMQEYERRLNMNPTRFQAAMRETAKIRVERDMQLGNTIAVNSTPTFFLCCPDRKVVHLGALEQVEEYINRNER